MPCPNDTDHDGNCHLCAHLATGCFLADLAPCIESDLAPRADDGSLIHDVKRWGIHQRALGSPMPENASHCDQLNCPFAELPMCQ